MNNYLSLIAIGTVGVQCLLLMILQPIINIWLDDNAITVDYLTAFYFLMYSVEMIWISVQSTIVGGIGILRTQLIFYSIAVVVKIVLTVFVSLYWPESWEIVVLATTIGLLPYCIVQPIIVKRLLKSLIKTSE